jgi:ribosome-associated toxin RatA of RatAB toxin-antitoxin module
VVSRVQEYSQFVPWCVGSTVLRGGADSGYLEAELEVGFQVFTER